MARGSLHSATIGLHITDQLTDRALVDPLPSLARDRGSAIDQLQTVELNYFPPKSLVKKPLPEAGAP